VPTKDKRKVQKKSSAISGLKDSRWRVYLGKKNLLYTREEMKKKIIFGSL
jgi:hypothetical protein